ncbi:MAG: hypothetical protein ACRC0E_07665 [Soonwooa sp.]
MTLGPKSASNLMISPVHLVSNNRIIGETFPKDNGQFRRGWTLQYRGLQTSI